MLNKSNTTHLNNTDPALTGNIKITTEPNGDLSLGLFSNYGVTDFETKRFRIHENTTHSVNISKFLSQYIIDKDVLYKNSDVELYKSKPTKHEHILTKENISYLAPLWIINYDVPDFFIVFKVPSYIYFEQLHPLEDYHLQDYQEYFTNFINDYLKYSEIVYTHDFTSSKLGSYIRKQFPNFLEETYTTDGNYIDINCIDIKKGFYSNIVSYLENIETYTEEEIDAFVKLQFENNNVLSSNILNIEYLFNSDNCSLEDDEYCLYGLYFNKEQLSDLKINLNKLNERYSLDIKNLFDNYDRSEDYIIEDDFIKIDGVVNDVVIEDDIYLVNDRYNNYYNIISYDDEVLHLNTSKLYIDDIIGIDKYYNKQVYCELFNTKAFSNLKITLNKTKINVFNEGDYFNITSDLIDDKIEWRVIASLNSCCGSSDICHYIPNTIYATSTNVEIINHTSTEYYEINNERTLELNITFDTIIEFEVSNYIKLFWNNEYNQTDYLNSNDFEILDVIYDIDDETTTIKIIDTKGYNFINLETDSIKCEYKGKKYYYTYFNPIGKIEDVCKNISNSFNKFTNKIFTTEVVENDIIIKSNFDGYDFKNMKLNYNFINSNNDISNIKINDITLIGKKIYDVEDNLIYTTKYNTITFNGYSNGNYLNRFAVDKLFGLTNINKDSIITTKFSKSQLKQNKVEDVDITHSNYLENTTKYRTHYIYQIENDKDDIYLASTNTLNLNKQFYPKIYKLSSFDITNI